jgi:hypothetical protein
VRVAPLPPIAAGPGALHPLLAPLGELRRVRVDSDLAFVKVLEAKKSLAVHAKGKLTPIPEVHGSQTLTPSEILLELAAASTPTLGPTLQDLSLRWAWLRYCWAFASVPSPGSPVPDLVLSPATMTMGQHQKVISSEQLGVGVGLYLARRALEKRHNSTYTVVIDADEAIDNGGLGGLGLYQSAPSRPDYFVKVGSLLGPWSMLYVLECKGTHKDSNLAQIRKGMNQVRSVRKTGKGSQFPPGIISAARLSDKRIDIRMVDPPAKEDSVWAGDEPEESPRTTIHRDGDGNIEISDPVAFRVELSGLDRAGLLAFAGRYDTAARAVPERLRKDDARAQAATGTFPQRSIEFGSARKALGISATIPLDASTQLIATCAVDSAALTAAEDPDPASLRDARRELSESLAGDSGSHIDVAEESALRVVSTRGHVLELRVAPLHAD